MMISVEALGLIGSTCITAAAITALSVFFTRTRASKETSVVKRTWMTTGRINFRTPPHINQIKQEQHDTPAVFGLMVEESRVIESISGQDIVEIHWRMATLKEAKAVSTYYDIYLHEHPSMLVTDHLSMTKPVFGGVTTPSP